jgi:GNAT superfamily N-acetyltransferase
VGTVTPSPSAAPFSAPAPITADHDVSRFDCGKPELNDWLRNRAYKNEARASRCFVVSTGKAVVGFYTLSAGGVHHSEVPGALRRNMPAQIPVIVLGRMAVDQACQGRQLGRHLLRDALRRALSASREIGARAVLVHAKDQAVVPFYTQYGFRPFPEAALTLFLSTTEIAAALD